MASSDTAVIVGAVIGSLGGALFLVLLTADGSYVVYVVCVKEEKKKGGYIRA